MGPDLLPISTTCKELRTVSRSLEYPVVLKVPLKLTCTSTQAAAIKPVGVFLVEGTILWLSGKQSIVMFSDTVANSLVPHMLQRK